MTSRTQPITTVPRQAVVLPKSADGSSFAICKAASAPLVEIALPEGADPKDFFIDAVNWQLPRAVITRVRTCAQHMRRGPAEIAKDTAPTLQMYLHVAAEVDADIEGRQEHFGPGDIVIYDSRQGFEAKASDIDARILMVSRDRAPALFLSPGIHGLKLPGGDAATRLLAAWIESLIDTIDAMTVAEADHAVVAIWQLAAGIVEARLARQDERQWVEPTLEAALAYIGHRLDDPDLSPQDVRAHLGISRSGIYRMFERFGGIDTAIRQRRADAALRTILSRAAPRLALKELAQRHGFRNETSFVRAFEARFGVPPAALRAKILARDDAWLKAQASRAGFASLEAWIAALGVAAYGEDAAR